MKKVIEKVVKVERSFCNICEKEIVTDPFNKKRIEMVRGLFKITDFDAHETCINKVVRAAFTPYLPIKEQRKGK